MTGGKSDKKQSGSERRRAKRHPIEVPIEFAVGHSMLIHASTNLSERGAFFKRAIPYREGTRARLRILLPGEPPIACEGEVVNIPDRRDFGMGVQFCALAPEDEERIQRFAALHFKAER